MARISSGWARALAPVTKKVAGILWDSSRARSRGVVWGSGPSSKVRVIMPRNGPLSRGRTPEQAAMDKQLMAVRTIPEQIEWAGKAQGSVSGRSGNTGST